MGVAVCWMHIWEGWKAFVQWGDGARDVRLLFYGCDEMRILFCNGCDGRIGAGFGLAVERSIVVGLAVHGAGVVKLGDVGSR